MTPRDDRQPEPSASTPWRGRRDFLRASLAFGVGAALSPLRLAWAASAGPSLRAQRLAWAGIRLQLEKATLFLDPLISPDAWGPTPP
jgi:hypothetical protein